MSLFLCSLRRPLAIFGVAVLTLTACGSTAESNAGSDTSATSTTMTETDAGVDTTVTDPGESTASSDTAPAELAKADEVSEGTQDPPVENLATAPGDSEIASVESIFDEMQEIEATGDLLTGGPCPLGDHGELFAEANMVACMGPELETDGITHQVVKGITNLTIADFESGFSEDGLSVDLRSDEDGEWLVSEAFGLIYFVHPAGGELHGLVGMIGDDIQELESLRSSSYLRELQSDAGTWTVALSKFDFESLKATADTTYLDD